MRCQTANAALNRCFAGCVCRGAAMADDKAWDSDEDPPEDAAGPKAELAAIKVRVLSRPHNGRSSAGNGLATD